MGKKFEIFILRTVFIVSLCLLPIALLKKSPLKDWLLVYSINALTNGIIDKVLNRYKLLHYPVRLFPKIFNINFLFDYLSYPLMTVLYNQLTEKDKPFAIFYKLLYFILPVYFLELWAVKNTNLIKWGKNWKWYYSFLSLLIKSLGSRAFIGIIRKLDKKY